MGNLGKVARTFSYIVTTKRRTVGSCRSTRESRLQLMLSSACYYRKESGAYVTVRKDGMRRVARDEPRLKRGSFEMGYRKRCET